MHPSHILPGKSHPLGATINPGGVNFSVHSKHASAVELLLFDDVDAPGPAHTIMLDISTNRSSYYWHVFVPGIGAGQLYAYRAYGPFIPEQGLRFDSQKVLLDPYGRGVVLGRNYSRKAAGQPGSNAACCMKSVVVDPRAYNWEGDLPLKHPFEHTVIYEMHMAGFTRHPSSGVAEERRGTYAGLVEKIPYLKELGITAVELLPVFQFDPQDAPEGLSNYWGYSPVSFFAPHMGYSSRQDALGPMDEFRDMVKALHRARIEVILDVVYNHTTEGDENGPMLSFRGLENRTYYLLDRSLAHYTNYSGCGNTLNTNQSIVRRMIVDSLHHWVQLMHVDGFRFDLASILSRDEQGKPQKSPPLLWEIELDPILASTKLIAEAWDAAGLYQVGTFVGDFWKEWNGRFRDDVRSFWKAEPGTVPRLASRFLASPDLFEHEDREAEQSVNFITCHDGFTLNDLVSYNAKHNEANLQKNRDGADDNRSWNCGVEGPTGDAQIEALRSRQVRNFLATTLLALGAPMLLMGDEARRTQQGNNNGYCQDNAISWFDWRHLETHAGLYRFVQELIRLRMQFSTAQPHAVELDLKELLQKLRFEWHGVQLYQPDWADRSHSLAFTVHDLLPGWQLHFILNAYWEALDFELPPLAVAGGHAWLRLIDTALDSPRDILRLEQAEPVQGEVYTMRARAFVLLARPSQ